MKWSEQVIKCANELCQEMVTHRNSLEDGVWTEDAENTCCCTIACHEKHLEQTTRET